MRLPAAIRLVLILGVLLGVVRASRAQCDDWRAVPEFARADVVRASTVWDPDGAGSQPPRLVIGGRFAVAGWPNGVNAASIASWDGVSWQALGSGLVGLPQYSAVYALTVYNGQLIAGGTFTTAGGSAIPGVARWNGSTWQPLGTGLNPAESPYVSALAVYNGELIVAGSFITAGGVTVNRIARWNGTSWLSMAGGTTSGGISALAVYNNQLIAGGTFSAIGAATASRIAAWNGASWSPLGAGIDPIDALGSGADSEVQSLAVLGGELIAGGRFTGAGGVPAKLVAAWNGVSWHALGAGLEDTFNTVWPSTLRRGAYALGVYNSQLVAAGRFTGSAGTTATNIAAWNGSSWNPLGPGLGVFPSAFADEGVYSVTPFAGDLFATGVFPNSGSAAVQSVARWNGAAWTPTQGVLYSTSTPVYALLPWAGGMLVGGDYSYLYLQNSLAYNFAKWTGLSVKAGDFSPDGAIRVMGAFNRSPPISADVYVAGDFTNIYPPGAAGIPASRIVTTNSLFGIGWQAMGAGFNATVRAIEKHNGSLYVGGDFTASGATPIGYIARWTGSAWQQVGLGLNGPCYALKSYNGYLYAGGTFTSAGGSATGGLGRFDGTNWLTVGGFFSGSVYALSIYNNELVIGGQYPGINSSPNLARYNGSVYSTYSTGGTNAPVRALTVSNSTLIIGGDFTTAGGIPASHIARWNGSAWSDIRGGTDIDGPVYALSTYAGELHVGGAFKTLKNGAVGSMGYARYLDSGVPWIARQPTSLANVCPGPTLKFEALPAVGYNNLSFAWRRNGVPIANGPSGSGSTYSGANTATLSILNPSETDNASYDCAITSPCGNATSFAATLAVCYANCDCSTSFPILNVNDFTCFLNKYAAGDPYANCDGSTLAPVLNVNDFSCFLNKFAAGCPAF